MRCLAEESFHVNTQLHAFTPGICQRTPNRRFLIHPPSFSAFLDFKLVTSQTPALVSKATAAIFQLLLRFRHHLGPCLFSGPYNFPTNHSHRPLSRLPFIKFKVVFSGPWSLLKH